MDKINFENLPSTNTPISAENLNKLQDNIETQIRALKNYSTEEHIIGTWINGKPLYRKVIVYGSLPNATEKGVKHNIDNLVDNIIKVDIIAKGNDACGIPFISLNSTQENISYRISNTYLTIITGTDRSSLTAIAILEYTKTID